jgi:ParB-like chromosome segregation protein Spo0J
MKTQKLKISEIKMNPNNPRVIKDDKFSKLVKSIQEFPKMLEIRPIVVNGDMIVLGGNMRLKACKEAGLKEVPVVLADDLTEDEQKQFIIKDNVGFGEWDWDMLANEWETDLLDEWGLTVPNWGETPNYDILDDEEANGQLDDMTNGVKKAIQIEFDLEHYDEAFELVKFWREQGAYVGAMIVEHLKAEKQKL